MGVLKSQVKNLKLPVNIAWIGAHLTAYVQNRTKHGLSSLFFRYHTTKTI
jgi:hypothetical protein